MGTISASLVPCLTTMLTLIGARPTAWAVSMPSRTSRTAKSTSFILRNVASSMASRLTLTRDRPALRSDCALRPSSDALVVSVRSSGLPETVSMRASISTSFSMFLRSSGSPPVSRIFSTPCDTNTRAARSISSKLSSSACGRKV
ncbi:hypothetical protein D3C86_1507860 [compost metagenome]